MRRHRRPRHPIAAALAAVVGLTIPLAASAAAASDDVTEILRLEAPGQAAVPVRCVTPGELARRSDQRRDGSTLMGLTVMRGRRPPQIRRSSPSVCKPIARYRLVHRLFGSTVVAISTVLHEAAHARGVTSEWRAECTSIPGTLRMLERWGADAGQLRQAKRFLRVEAERHRPGPYKLRGRC